VGVSEKRGRGEGEAYFLFGEIMSLTGEPCERKNSEGGKNVLN